ncbi:MAG TPA: hypothetical protein VGH49_16780 [Xanthobacteraceae bacterium]
MVAVSIGAGIVLAVLFLVFWGRHPLAPGTEHATAPPAQEAPATAETPAGVTADIPAITKAMSDCDAVAAGDRDSLYFLVLPLLPANPNDQTWRANALQTIGNAYLLLSTQDALDGLRNHSLLLRPDRYTFSVLDSQTGQTYSWTSATRMSRLSFHDAGAVKTFKLGFDFSAAQTGAQWSAEIKRDPGTCYWVSALNRQ